MGEIFLLRHGQTEWNAAGRLQGQMDSPLTAHGRDQAAQLGRILHRVFATRSPPPLHVSPLGRTRDTATIVRRYAPGFTTMTMEPRLQEVSFGAWEGLNVEDVEAGWPVAVGGAKHPDWFFRSPGGETFEAAYRRVQGWMEDLDGPVVAVSHGLLGRLMRGIWLRLSIEDMLCLPIPQDVVWHLVEGEVSALVEA